MNKKKLFWHKQTDGALYGMQYPVFHIFQNSKDEWILVYTRNPKVKTRQLSCKTEQQCKILANKLLKP